MKIPLFVCALFLFSSSLLFQGYKPKSGFVPDSATAVKIAEAVLTPVYGENKVKAERPYTATLKDEVWIVDGTLHCPGSPEGSAAGCEGGVATVHISKADGHIVFMWHGQ